MRTPYRTANTSALTIQIQILGVERAKLHTGYEARCSGGIWIYFDHLGIFNVQPNLRTPVFLLFVSA